LGDFVVNVHLQCLFNIARSHCLKLASNFFLQMREYRGQRTLGFARMPGFAPDNCLFRPKFSLASQLACFARSDKWGKSLI